MLVTRGTLIFALFGCGQLDKQEDSHTDRVEDTSSDVEESQYNIWSGDSITFTKQNFADHTDPANQDVLTNRVVLTRTDRGSLINVVIEESASSTSPEGTEWSIGSTDEIEQLFFTPLKEAVNNNMSGLAGKSLVLHLLEDDIYIDVTFLSWTAGGAGGGFSYERSTSE
ncbi:MAG: hypothetical protein VX278_07595 [Myxococcota bacterium]|nr:hypothetical protein [Myxococcota bacterium]